MTEIPLTHKRLQAKIIYSQIERSVDIDLAEGRIKAEDAQIERIRRVNQYLDMLSERKYTYGQFICAN